MTRNCIAYVFHGAASADGQAWLQQRGQDGSALRFLATYTGQVLVNPPNDQLTAAFGLAGLPEGTVDVAVIGAGPAGLVATVFAASEGLSTLLLNAWPSAGQAGSSSLIRNYLGFPRGISGPAWPAGRSSRPGRSARGSSMLEAGHRSRSRRGPLSA